MTSSINNLCSFFNVTSVRSNVWLDQETVGLAGGTVDRALVAETGEVHGMEVGVLTFSILLSLTEE